MVMDRVTGCYDNFEVALTKDDIDNIIDGLNSFNGANWDLDGGSILEWDGEWGYSDYIQQNIKYLQLLRKLMDKYELEVYFYDSY